MTGDSFHIITALLTAVLAKVVESVMLPAVRSPDLLVVLAACVGWSCDLWNALPAGFAIGLIEDLIVGRALGSRAISLAVAAAAVSALKRFINPDSFSSKILAALASATLADLVTWAILRSMRMGIAATFFVREIWLPSALWSLLLIGPLHAVIRRTAAGLQNLWPSSGTKGRETAV